MESWQKKHITTNFPELVELTTCNTELLLRLLSKRFLSNADLEELEAITTKTDKSYRFFKKIMTRKAYFELIEALQENGQTQVCEILQRGAKENQIVRFQTKEIGLSYILKLFNVPIPKKQNDNLLKQGIPVLVNNRIHTGPKHFIQRRISRSQKISSDIFRNPGNEIFAVKGLQRSELTNLANKMEMDESSNQLKHFTVQFILLEHDSHFQKICNNTTSTVHLIQYSSDKTFNWIKTSGSLEKIRKFVLDEEVLIREDEFLQECLQSGMPVCIAASPGMGKSFLLTKMAQDIMNANPFQLVRFLNLKDFLVKLKQPVTGDALCDEIAGMSSDYEIGRDLVTKALKSEVTYLFLDGIDEVRPDQVQIVAEILKCASKFKQTRIYAATNFHMKLELEDMIGGLGFTMLPFRDEEQIDFLVKFWQGKVGSGGSSERLKVFGSACLKSLKVPIGEQTIVGIPLICRMIARIYQDDAEEHSKSELNKQPSLSRTISSIFEIYQIFMNAGFSKLHPQNSWLLTTYQKEKLKLEIKAHHVRLAVEELIPEKKGVLTPFLVTSQEERANSLFLPGILEPSNDNTSFRFIHRTFAEYLVAELITEVIKLPDSTFNQNWHWFTWIFPITPIGNPHERNEIWKLLFDHVLVTRNKQDLIYLKIGEKVTVNSYEFEQPTICYFLNAFLAQNVSIQSSKMEISQLPDFVKMYTAAVVSDKPAIGKLLSKIFEGECNKLPWSELLLLAAKYSGDEMMKQLTELLRKAMLEELFVAHLEYPGEETYVTPLHITAQKGDYKMFEYLWNNGGFCQSFQEKHKTSLLHECVVETSFETQKVIDNKLQIINLLLPDDKKTTEQPHDGSTLLLQPNIHVKLFEYLISKGSQLTDNNRCKNALHIAARNGNLPIAEFLITKHSALVHTLDENGNTPLHLSALNRTNQHVKIQLKLLEAGADIYQTNEKGSNPFVNGMKFGKGLEMKVIKAIETKYPQLLSAFGGQGLKSLLTNSNLMVLDWNESLYTVAEYLILKGAVVRCGKSESPWGLEQVGSNMEEIVETTELTEELLQTLQKFSIFNKNANISDKHNLFEILKETQGSYEKLMISLITSKQMKPFMIMKQCLQADDNDSVWFVTPPPRVLDFIFDPEPRVLILQTHNCLYSAIRIRDTVYPDVVVEMLEEFSNEHNSVIICSQSKINEILSSLLSFGKKTICIVNETVTLTQINENDMKFVKTACDEVKWNDLSETVRTGLTSSLTEFSEILENSNAFLDILVRKFFETKITVLESEVDILNNLCKAHVKLTFLGLMQIAVESKFQNFVSIFKTKDLKYSELEIAPTTIESILKVDYFIALLVVNKKYWDYLNMEMLVKFVECVVFKCENDSDCPSFVNSKICKYVNILLNTNDEHAFLGILNKLDKVSRKNLLLGSAKSNYVEILKVLATSCKSGDSKYGIDKRTIGKVIMNGGFESVAYLYDFYAKSNVCLIVEFKDQLWLPLRLAAQRGDLAIVEYIIQYHGYEWEPGNCNYLLDDKQLIRMQARIVKSHVNIVNQPAFALQEIVPEVTKILQNRNIRLLYVALDFGADVCAQDEDGNTVLHLAPKYLTTVQYHEFIVYLICSHKTECFQVLHKLGVTVLHCAVLSLEVLPETLELYKSQNVDFNAITDENTDHKNSVLHWAVQGKRSANMIKKLIECGANVEATNKKGDGLLHFASEFGNVSAISLLVSLGCSVKSVNKNQQTPLHLAFHNSNDSLVEVVRLLIEHNSDVNAKGNLGRTPLHSAVEHCKSLQVVSAIRFLIAYGADVNIQDNEGNTMLLVPLSNRTLSDYHQIVQIIEELSPACLEKRDDYELTALHRAVQFLEIQSDTLKLLIKYVCINAVDSRGFPPLFYAIWGGRSREFMIMMIENGANPRMRENWQANALHKAAMYGNVPALEYFLERGELGVNETDWNGNSPLHYAFQKQNAHVEEVVRLLVEAGGDVNMKSNSGRSPLDLAVEGEKNNKVKTKTVALMKT